MISVIVRGRVGFILIKQKPTKVVYLGEIFFDIEKNLENLVWSPFV